MLDGAASVARRAVRRSRRCREADAGRGCLRLLVMRFGRTTDSGAWRRVSRPIAGDASASRAAKAGCEGRPGGSGGPGSRGGCRLQVREACGLCELEGAQQVALAACELGALLAGAGGAG